MPTTPCHSHLGSLDHHAPRAVAFSITIEWISDYVGDQASDKLRNQDAGRLDAAKRTQQTTHYI